MATQAVTSDIAESLGLSRPEGVLISDIDGNTPAARAGLREGDLVTAVNGVAVNDPAALNFQIGTGRTGDTVPLSVRRNGRLETVRVRLENKPDIPRDQRTLAGGHPMAGATVANLSPDVITQFGADPDEVNITGVIVTAVGDGYAGRGAGFRRGDVVERVNGRPIRTVSDLQAVLAAGAPWRVDVRRSGRTVSATFGA